MIDDLVKRLHERADEIRARALRGVRNEAILQSAICGDEDLLREAAAALAGRDAKEDE